MTAEAPVASPPDDAQTRQPRRLSGSTVRIVAAYVAGLIATSAGVIAQAQHSHLSPLSKAFRPWDSGFYVGIAAHGYDFTYVTQHGPERQNNTAFFPGYPLLVRASGDLFGWASLTMRGAAWAVNAGCGLAAMLVIAAVVRHWYAEPVAVRTAQAVALFPGSAVFVLAYAEGLFLLLAAACVLAITRRQWWWAGLAALAAGGVRANGLYLSALLAVVAVHAIWTRRNWLSLVAPLLAPLGFLGYQAYLWHATGRRDEWFAVEHYGWRQRNDFGAETLRILTGAHPMHSGLLVLQLFGIGCFLLVCVLAVVRRVKLPGLLLGYTAAMILPLLLASRLGLRPRFLLTAFPLMLVVAQALRGYAFAAYCVLSVVGLVWSGWIYAGPWSP